MALALLRSSDTLQGELRAGILTCTPRATARGTSLHELNVQALSTAPPPLLAHRWFKAVNHTSIGSLVQRGETASEPPPSITRTLHKRKMLTQLTNCPGCLQSHPFLNQTFVSLDLHPPLPLHP